MDKEFNMGIVNYDNSALCIGSAEVRTPVVTDSSLSGNGYPNSPIGVVPTAITRILWSGTTANGLRTGALNDSLDNYDMLELYGSGTDAGQAFTRVPIYHPFNSSYMAVNVYTLTPWANTNYSLCAGQRMQFPTHTSFSAGSSYFFGMTNNGTGWAGGNYTSRPQDIRLYRIDGVKYNTGEQ
jgi:hypothetical protein